MPRRVLNRCHPIARRSTSFLGALALFLAVSVHADTTTLTIAGASKGTSSAPVTMEFPVTRSGDLGFETVLEYHTVDGTAFAGTDYSAASGTITIPAGASSAMIPVGLDAFASNGPNLTFQLQLDSAAGIGPTPSFAAQQAFATGSTPYSVTFADVNGDGKADLIVANYGADTISVLLNTTTPGATTPSFAAQQTFPTKAGPIAVTAADINGDGKPDLIVANLNGGGVSVLLNTTAPGATIPTFAMRQTFATGTAPRAVAASDLNGDGKPDLIVANLNGSSVSVLLNTTTPGATTLHFAAQQPFAAGPSPFSVLAHDVNGDGVPDLIVAIQGENTVSVLLNTTAPGATTPSFAARHSFATGSVPYSVTAADINGDGKPDLTVANGVGNSISVLLNTTAAGATTPSFAAQQTFAAGSSPFAVTATDFNGDGKPDLVVVNDGSRTVSVLLNTTAPGAATLNFAAQQIFNTASHPQSVTAADVNGDGKLDLVAANTYDNTVSVLLNTTAPGASTSAFTAQPTFAVGTYPYTVTTADLNGDGKPDIIAANFNDNTISALLNTTAPGASTASFAVQQTFSTGTLPYSVTAADVNGDGNPDLIVANWGDNAVSVRLNTTAPGASILSFAAPQPFAAGNRPISVSAADVNGDGKPDLIVANFNDITVSVLLNITAPGATTPSFSAQQTFATGDFPYCVIATDMNGDGKRDLIVANDGALTASVLLNTTTSGAGISSFAAQLTFSTGGSPTSVTAADVNGDGKPDLIVANFNDQTVSVLLNTTAPGASAMSFAAQQTYAAGSGSYAVTAADVNGDGKPDMIVADLGDSTVSVLLNTQYQALFTGSPATGTIVHDYIFANGVE